MGAAICLLSAAAIAFQSAFWYLQGRWIDLPVAAAWRAVFGDLAALAPLTPLTAEVLATPLPVLSFAVGCVVWLAEDLHRQSAARRAFELYLQLDPERGRGRDAGLRHA